MSTISESNLPGVGRKFQIEAASGDRLTIVIHDDGTRELYHFARKSPDKVASVVTLSDSEARQVAGIIGDPAVRNLGTVGDEIGGVNTMRGVVGARDRIGGQRDGIAPGAALVYCCWRGKPGGQEERRWTTASTSGQRAGVCGTARMRASRGCGIASHFR